MGRRRRHGEVARDVGLRRRSPIDLRVEVDIGENLGMLWSRFGPVHQSSLIVQS